MKTKQVEINSNWGGNNIAGASILIGEETTLQELDHKTSLDHLLWYHVKSPIDLEA